MTKTTYLLFIKQKFAVEWIKVDEVFTLKFAKQKRDELLIRNADVRLVKSTLKDIK